ncbi:hypothetical protein C7T94_06730 [Pedobacter yulinensis]|uniref:Outer membrane protein beta-barrel domain-containing protein n=1 Tax=Pedobacter yulinensis TaxID=2126353 RepID=A0A2T3HPR6_9SPHI|nr:outer membrane beta-barrel family protein [Pedobacter yulinensis]PST84397.1 hypothetical protein C7T94_06730 [Pedobacter yulinensis]
MRNLVFMLLIFVCIQLQAQDRKLTLDLQKKPLKILLKEIELQCGYTFVYSDEVISDTMIVSVSAVRKPVSQVLNAVLPEQMLFYQRLSEQMIVIGSSRLLRETMGTGKYTLISGRVVNQSGRAAVPFATISFFENKMHLSGALSNEQGTFSINQKMEAGRHYSLKISSLGYETVMVNVAGPATDAGQIDLGDIHLEEKAKRLKDVMVKGGQQLVELDGSNLIFNVSRSMTAQGTNALELLGRAPGVTVSADNTISLNGKAGAAVLIDGKQTYLSGREIAELLKSMSASDIRSVEIINSPGPRYDASGTAGIINVRTAKSAVQGFNGSLTSGLSYGVYLRNNQDLSLNYKKDKLSIFGNYSHFIGYYSYLYGADRMQQGMFYNSFTDDVDKRNKMGTRLGADFAIDQKHTVGVLLNGNFLFGGGITDTRTAIGPLQSMTTDQVLTAINDYYAQQTQRYNVNVNYKYEDTAGRVINFDADYGDFTKRSGNLQSNRYNSAGGQVLSDNLYRSVNGIDIGLRAVKVDYTTNFARGKLETGAKYSSVSSGNDSRFLEIVPGAEVLDQTRSNAFAFREEISSLYVNYKRKLGKWQLEGGLRAEHSKSLGELATISPISGNERSTGRKYTNLFPFFSANLKSSAAHSFSLSYSNRIDRPAYQNLNPFIYLLDELSFWQGNPFLRPQLSHRVLLQYAYKSATIAGLSYTYTDDFSVEVTDTIDRTRVVMVPRNLGIQQHLALTLTQTLRPYAWWNILFNGTVFGIHNDIDFGAGRKLNLKQAAGRFSLQQTFKLPFRLSGEVMAFYNSRRLSGANQFPRSTSQVDLGLQRSFMKDRASLRLVFSDIYKGSRARSTQSVGDLYVYNYSYFETRQVKLNFSYRWARGSSTGPRNRSSALENENGRIR